MYMQIYTWVNKSVLLPYYNYAYNCIYILIVFKTEILNFKRSRD